jgi:membrane-bound acyltransferase YfiQ involved in biofilm formation
MVIFLTAQPIGLSIAYKLQLCSVILSLFSSTEVAEHLANFLYRYRYLECVFVLIMLIGSIVQLLVFIPVIHTAIPVPDQAAHYFEYSGEMANCVIVFVFALSVYLGVNQRFDDHIQKLNGHFV